jgi:hypothetical protein
MAGRTWLPDDVRAQARATFTATFGSFAAGEVARIIGEYQLLTDPGDDDADEAWSLLLELHNLIDSGATPKMKGKCVVIQGGSPDLSGAGEGAPAPAQAGDALPGSGKDDGDNDGDGSGAGDDGDDDDGDSGSASTGGGAGGPDDGNEPGAKAPDTLKDVRKQIAGAVAEQIKDDDDLADILDTLRHGRAGDGGTDKDAAGRYWSATDEARRLHHEVGDALLDLKDASEPGWLKRVDFGRLNVRRLADPFVDPDQLFDRYEPGQLDASELEVVLLLDVSGSMGSYLRPLAEAAWAIRHAVDDLEGSCTVICWESGPHRVMARAGERPDDRMFVPASMGGTVPDSALSEAFAIVSDSQSRNRLVIVLTDGDWWDGGRKHGAGETIAALNQSGAITVCALLGPHAGDNLHGCQFGARIDDPYELARLFRTIAAQQIGRWS